MTAVLVVESCGPGASVQDGGRVGWRRFGVSGSGAMDRLALGLANALAGNPPDAAAVETTLAGLRLRVEGGPVLFAVAGPGVGMMVDERAVPPGVSVRADPGQRVTLSPVRDGVHGYLAVAGGVATTPEMGSRSVHLRSGIGGAMLAPGTRLPVGDCAALAPRALAPVPGHADGPIRVMPGPQHDWFDAAALDTLVAVTWEVGERSDRMGRFLVGPGLAPRAGSMVSDGVVPGSLQVPPSGQPIILMRDCQTTGGYPKLATVISADLDRLAQMPAGARFSLALVDRATAVDAAARLARSIAALAPRPVGGVDVGRLMAENLIGGVIDARC
ncbi:MAG: biotin-dependent carboxyltransferase family protein [Gemmobacter sp.]|nr:biotin-dependent carboxyltransferase family protein [Gemmobacter sp.]